jgi:hypothetical protein
MRSSGQEGPMIESYGCIRGWENREHINVWTHMLQAFHLIMSWDSASKKPSPDAALWPWARTMTQNKNLIFINSLVCGMLLLVTENRQRCPGNELLILSRLVLNSLVLVAGDGCLVKFWPVRCKQSVWSFLNRFCLSFLLMTTDLVA